jgi:hypothetical protein
MERAGTQCDEAAHAVTDDDGTIAEAGIVDHAHQLAGVAVAVVGRPVAAVAHAAQIHRRDPELVDEERGNEVPPVGVRAIAMHEQQTGLVALIAPQQVVNRTTLDFDEAALWCDCQHAAEPVGGIGMKRQHGAGVVLWG